MPIQKASFKDLRKSRKRALFNKNVKLNVKNLAKDTVKAINKKDEKIAKEIIAKAIKALDKAAQKNIIKKGTAARKKSRLMKKLNEMGKKK